MLNRPQNARPVVESIAANTTVDFSVTFICSRGDEEEIYAVQQTGARILIGDYGVKHQYPRKMNAGLAAGDREFVFLGADDLDFLPGWDEWSLQAAHDTGAGVIGLDDKANVHVRRGVWSTHPLARRAYLLELGGALEGPGSFLWEGYDHNYSERELCGLAMSRSKWFFASRAKVQHKHPAWGTAPEDDTYRKGAAGFFRDRQLFYRRATNFWPHGLAPQEKNLVRRMQRAPQRSRS